MSSSDDFFSGGLPSAKFDQQGKVVGGRIIRVGDVGPQRDFATGDPLTWPDGSVKVQLPIDIQTDERDSEIPGDTGARTLYVKGDLKRAITEALRKAGVRGAPQVGGTLEVAWTGSEPPKTRGFNDKKLYSARYTAPAAGDSFFTGGQQASEPGPTQQAENRQRAQSNSAPAADPWGSAPPARQSATVPAGPAVNPFDTDTPPF